MQSAATMDAIVAQAIKDTGAARKSSVPWSLDEPYPQSYHAFDPATSSWIPKSPLTTDIAEISGNSSSITNIALYTWNIDFMLPFAEARMRPALEYLDTLTKGNPPTTASVIFLQECVPSDLLTTAATPWVREHYHLTDLDSTNWATTHYGTVTLVDTRLPITAAFRVHFSKTRMERDAFFIDVAMGSNGSDKIRLCNSHLESLALEPPFRPPQMQLIARYLHEESVYAGLTAGDFNGVQDFDRTIHVENSLKDAYLEMGGKEDEDSGFTWGQQAATKLREQFGCSRIDKVYFCGSIKLLKFERFGEDVLVEGEEEAKQIVALGFEKPWVTDHLGVMAEVKVLPKS